MPKPKDKKPTGVKPPFMMTSRFPGRCRECGEGFGAGTKIKYFPQDKNALCEGCATASGPEDDDFIQHLVDISIQASEERFANVRGK